MPKKGLNSLNNEFYDYLITSLKVNDNLVKLNNYILMTKNEYYVNIRNKDHIINNDTLINKTKCIKSKSAVRENINSLKNIKNNLYNVKKDNNSLSIGFKNLKEEYINKFNKRVKTRSIFINVKANRFNKMFDRFDMRFNRFINKTSLKTNACTTKDSAIIKNHADACTSKNDLIVKNYADTCASTDDLIVKNDADVFTSTDDLIAKNYVNACTNTDDLVKNYAGACTNTDDLVKNHVDACTNTDDVCTNENENENKNEPSTNENEIKNEPCTNDDDSEDDSDDVDSYDKPGTSGNNDNKPATSGNNDNKPVTSGIENNNDNKPSKNDNKDNKDNKPVNNDNEKSHQVSPSALFSNNIAKIIKLIDELENDEIYDDDEWLVFAQLNKINLLLDELIGHIWLIIYNKNREKNEIINIDIDKDNDIEGYVNIYQKIIDDKVEFVNRIVELNYTILLLIRKNSTILKIMY